MLNYTKEELMYMEAKDLANRWCGDYEDKRPSYHYATSLIADKQEGMIYLFAQWLDYVKASEFGNDDGMEGGKVYA